MASVRFDAVTNQRENGGIPREGDESDDDVTPAVVTSGHSKAR